MHPKLRVLMFSWLICCPLCMEKFKYSISFLAYLAIYFASYLERLRNAFWYRVSLTLHCVHCTWGAEEIFTWNRCKNKPFSEVFLFHRIISLSSVHKWCSGNPVLFVLFLFPLTFRYRICHHAQLSFPHLHTPQHSFSDMWGRTSGWPGGMVTFYINCW